MSPETSPTTLPTLEQMAGVAKEVLNDPATRGTRARFLANAFVTILEWASGSGWPNVDAIRHERLRQVAVEGYSAEHDDSHICGEIGRAAAFYAAVASGMSPEGLQYAGLWPWHGQPKAHGRKRSLVIAGALIVAELDRLERLEREGGRDQE